MAPSPTNRWPALPRIQPTVPSTRTAGNWAPGRSMWRKEMELTSASVGMNITMLRMMTTEKPVTSVCRPAMNSRTALARCSTARMRSAEKKRSTMNGAIRVPALWLTYAIPI